MRRLVQTWPIGILLATGPLAGCKNSCEELTAIVCERSGADLDACKASPPVAEPVAPGQKPVDPCDKIRAVTASCDTLKSEAGKATAEDKDACRADLELVRALDKQTM